MSRDLSIEKDTLKLTSLYKDTEAGGISTCFPTTLMVEN